MAIASHFAMPVADAVPPSYAERARPPAAATPPAQDAAATAERAFGRATDAMAYYSDHAFGPMAARTKRAVDQAGRPGR